MKKFQRTVFFLIIFIIVGYFWITKNREQKQKYFQELNLKLTGVVENANCLENSNGFCIIDIRVLSSNVYYYDPRNSLKYYYCIIKNNIAEIYQCGDSLNRFVNDTVAIDTKKGVIVFRSKGKNYRFQVCDVFNNPKFFNYVKNHNQNF